MTRTNDYYVQRRNAANKAAPAPSCRQAIVNCGKYGSPTVEQAHTLESYTALELAGRIRRPLSSDPIQVGHGLYPTGF